MAGRATLLGIAAAGVIGLAGCGGDGSSGTGEANSVPGSGANSNAVTIKDFAYSPASVTVATGTTIEFTNRDAADHTVTASDMKSFDSGTISQGKAQRITPNSAGTFAFFCRFHPFMKGTITVMP